MAAARAPRPAVELALSRLEECELGLGFLVVAAGGLPGLLHPALDCGKVSEGQLCGHDVVISDGGRRGP